MQRIAAGRRLTRLLLALMDALILLGSGLAATWIRFGSAAFPHEFDRLLEHPDFIAYAVMVQLGLATTFELYRPESWRTKEYVLLRMLALAVFLATAFALGVYLVLPWRFGRGLLVITLVLSLLAQGMLRLLWLKASHPPPRRALVIGDGPIVRALGEELDNRTSAPFRIARYLPAQAGSVPDDLTEENLSDIDLVIVASLVHDPTVDRLAALNFRGITVVDAAGAYAALTGRIPVRQVNSRWFIATGDFASLAGSPFHHVQQFLDIIIATLLLAVTAPILLISCLAILLSDGPPVVYRQVRIGQFGKRFVLFKLRTMRRGSDKNGPAFAEEHDRRVLAVGRILRRWRIDELPQLFNVLRGEMSLVGPRPERPVVAEELASEIPFFAFRYSVRPGITGWAQVNLPYCSLTEDHLTKLEFDLYSLRHHGPAMYGVVLLRTLGALIFHPGR